MTLFKNLRLQGFFRKEQNIIQYSLKKKLADKRILNYEKRK